MSNAKKDVSGIVLRYGIQVAIVLIFVGNLDRSVSRFVEESRPLGCFLLALDYFLLAAQIIAIFLSGYIATKGAGMFIDTLIKKAEVGGDPVKTPNAPKILE